MKTFGYMLMAVVVAIIISHIGMRLFTDYDIVVFFKNNEGVQVDRYFFKPGIELSHNPYSEESLIIVGENNMLFSVYSVSYVYAILVFKNRRLVKRLYVFNDELWYQK